ncbi:hypothetical protein RCL_jg227.t1 [Rhizophagus clarus]|uniref:Uncharacterized protein n=1 Tax=Rhizophagus clarus TaxID=94130 RepID=A0A8H3QXQ7_9GLOM|nr:hypothetical protein RCL_jg227.t1 [Rhizophagus clarus]
MKTTVTIPTENQHDSIIFLKIQIRLDQFCGYRSEITYSNNIGLKHNDSVRDEWQVIQKSPLAPSNCIITLICSILHIKIILGKRKSCVVFTHQWQTWMLRFWLIIIA